MVAPPPPDALPPAVNPLGLLPRGYKQNYVPASIYQKRVSLVCTCIGVGGRAKLKFSTALIILVCRMNKQNLGNITDHMSGEAKEAKHVPQRTDRSRLRRDRPILSHTTTQAPFATAGTTFPLITIDASTHTSRDPKDRQHIT